MNEIEGFFFHQNSNNFNVIAILNRCVFLPDLGAFRADREALISVPMINDYTVIKDGHHLYRKFTKSVWFT